MRKLTAILTLVLAILLLAQCACAEGIGQTYKAFEASYAENVVFINDNTGRMLLPHSLERDYDARGKRMYRIARGALAMEMHMDESGERIARCLITLTAPEHMSYGDLTHTDFATSGYHSYALLMAMDQAATPYERYSTVERVNWGIKQNGGAFETQVGDYTLSCKTEGGVATLEFTCDVLLPERSEKEEPSAPEIDIVENTEDSEGESLAG